MPVAVILVGLPGVGKSTFIESFTSTADGEWAVLSTDRYLDIFAAGLGKTYSEVFQEFIDKAHLLMYDDLRIAIKDRKNVIWDQTNLTPKSRRKKLVQFPSEYMKAAMVFGSTITEEEHRRRLDSRPGKKISNGLLMSMRSSYIPPKIEEGFNMIVHVMS